MSGFLELTVSGPHELTMSGPSKRDFLECRVCLNLDRDFAGCQRPGVTGCMRTRSRAFRTAGPRVNWRCGARRIRRLRPGPRLPRRENVMPPRSSGSVRCTGPSSTARMAVARSRIARPPTPPYPATRRSCWPSRWPTACRLSSLTRPRTRWPWRMQAGVGQRGVSRARRCRRWLVTAA